MFSRLATRTPIFSQTVRRFSSTIRNQWRTRSAEISDQCQSGSGNVKQNIKKNLEDMSTKIETKNEEISEEMYNKFIKMQKQRRNGNYMTILYIGSVVGATAGTGYGAYQGFKEMYGTWDNSYGPAIGTMIFGPPIGFLCGGLLGLTFPISIPAAIGAKISHEIEKNSKDDKSRY